LNVIANKYLLLIFSISVHLLLLLALHTSNKKTRNDQKLKPIEFNIVTAKKISKIKQNKKYDSHKKSKSQKSPVAARSQVSITKLSDLKISNHSNSIAKDHNFNTKRLQKLSGGYGQGQYNKYADKDGALRTMNSMSIAEYSRNIWFYEQLWNKLNNNITYPMDFAKQRISGHVNVHLLVNRKGQLINFLEVTGPENILKTYTMAVILPLLKSPLPKTHWLKGRDQIPLLISFQFITHDFNGTQSQDIITSDKGNHLKNTLVIKKHQVIDNKLSQVYNENIAPYIPPIIPIPGGLIIDFVAAYKMITTWGEPKEPLKRRRRLESLKKSLTKTIKESSINSNTKPL